jgi:carbonic anhydrase/acetyltransferase-like protein (isoleucine patch superfamily)
MKLDLVHHPEKIDPRAFIAPGVIVIGDVIIEAQASLWFGVIVRGDTESIVIGQKTNVQDGCILHVKQGKPCILGRGVTLGHSAIIHGATVEDDVLIGIRATVLNGARIGRGSVVAAGAVIAPGTVIPPRSMVMGIPGKVVRPTGDAEEAMIRNTAEHYCAYARAYAEHFPKHNR